MRCTSQYMMTHQEGVEAMHYEHLRDSVVNEVPDHEIIGKLLKGRHGVSYNKIRVQIGPVMYCTVKHGYELV